MRAIVFKNIGHIAVEERPRPEIRAPTDAIIKVQYAALCGSELHSYRGVEKVASTGFIMGHEFLGTVEQIGSAVTDLKIGEQVVSPFTTSCGICWFCQRGYSARCQHGSLFGSPSLDGGQAEFVRVPYAGTTLLRLRDAPHIADKRTLLFLGDIFPTGMYCVKNALQNLRKQDDVTLAIFGCGPVGLCAIIAAKHYLRQFGQGSRIYAIDSVASRLMKASSLGAHPLELNMAQPAEVVQRLKEGTQGRGVDAACEVVGHESALRLAFDSVRPFGILSSVGVHNAPLPYSGEDCFSKNITMIYGRCPVRSILPEAIEIMADHQKDFEGFVDRVLPIDKAVDGYEEFDKRKVQKVVFDLSL
ncbi:hypothetical protein PYCC9005_002771 [Savitreella phatthalungensis]